MYWIWSAVTIVFIDDFTCCPSTVFRKNFKHFSFTSNFLSLQPIWFFQPWQFSFYVQTELVSALTLLTIFICYSICYIRFFPSFCIYTTLLLFLFLILTENKQEDEKKEPSSASPGKVMNMNMFNSTALSVFCWYADSGAKTIAHLNNWVRNSIQRISFLYHKCPRFTLN